jgi:hypothetical protein
MLNRCEKSRPHRDSIPRSLRPYRVVIPTELSRPVFVQTYLLTHLLTDLLTPWSRVLLEKLNGLQLVKKLRAFYGTPRFITAFTFVQTKLLISGTEQEVRFVISILGKAKKRCERMITIILLCDHKYGGNHREEVSSMLWENKYFGLHLI